MEPKRWTHSEVLKVLEEAGVNGSSQPKPADQEKPKHWPADLKVDSKRQPWLPEDWGQGVRESLTGGRARSVYVSPEGKVVETKAAVEKACGRTFDELKDSDKVKRKVRGELSSDFPNITHWPDWLPKDWLISFRMSGGVKRTFYCSPSGRGFFNRGHIEKFLEKNAGESSPGAASPRGGKAPDGSGAIKPKEEEEEGSGEREAAAAEGAAPPVPTEAAPGSPQADSEQGAAPAEAQAGGAAAAKDGEPVLKAAAQAPEASASPAVDAARGGTVAAAAGEASGGGGAAPAEAPPAKRAKVEPGGTDEEVEQVEDGEPRQGYALRQCRAGAAWLVLPDDVVSLDLKAIGGQVEKAGWRCLARGEQRWDFAGAPDLVLYSSGKLLVRSAGREDARRVAKEYVAVWLSLE